MDRRAAVLRRQRLDRALRQRKDLEALGRQVDQVGAALEARGVTLPVRGMLCMANENDGLPAHGLVAVGGASVGTPDAVGRAIAGGGTASDATIDRAAAALREAFALRGFVARSEPEPGAELLSRPPRRVRRRPLARLARWAVATVLGRLVLLLAVGALAVAIDGAPSDSPPGTGSRLGLDDVRTALPDLRKLARASAGGKVHGPAIASTASRFRLTFRRGRCRVVVRVDRAATDVLAGAKPIAARHCAVQKPS